MARTAFPWHSPKRLTRRRLEESRGFPRGVLVLFLALAICLGLLISWSLGLSVQINTPTTQAKYGGANSAGINSEGLTLLSETNIGEEVQLLIDTGTLQNPANFDVAECLDELGINNSVLVLEQVSWESSGKGWLIVHSPANLSSVRNDGGEVSAAVVRSTCGTDKTAGPGASTLWSGTVLVAPQN